MLCSSTPSQLIRPVLPSNTTLPNATSHLPLSRAWTKSAHTLASQPVGAVRGDWEGSGEREGILRRDTAKKEGEGVRGRQGDGEDDSWAATDNPLVVALLLSSRALIGAINPKTPNPNY